MIQLLMLSLQNIVNILNENHLTKNFLSVSYKKSIEKMKLMPKGGILISFQNKKEMGYLLLPHGVIKISINYMLGSLKVNILTNLNENEVNASQTNYSEIEKAFIRCIYMNDIWTSILGHEYEIDFQDQENLSVKPNFLSCSIEFSVKNHKFLGYIFIQEEKKTEEIKNIVSSSYINMRAMIFFKKSFVQVSSLREGSKIELYSYDYENVVLEVNGRQVAQGILGENNKQLAVSIK